MEINFLHFHVHNRCETDQEEICYAQKHYQSVKSPSNTKALCCQSQSHFVIITFKMQLEANVGITLGEIWE